MKLSKDSLTVHGLRLSIALGWKINVAAFDKLWW